MSRAAELKAIDADFLTRMPTDIAAAMSKTDLALVASGILDAALTAGNQAPDFALSNARGGVVRLSHALDSGPVVLSFYRGGCRRSRAAKRHRCRMGRATLSQAHRLYAFSETLLTSFAQANIPYAVEVLLLLQFAEPLIARALAHVATAIPNLARWFVRHDARSARRIAIAKANPGAAG